MDARRSIGGAARWVGAWAALAWLAAGCPTPKPPEPGPGAPSNRDQKTPVAERALNVGDEAPPFSLPVAAGGTWSLDSAVAKGRVVLVFYRGHW